MSSHHIVRDEQEPALIIFNSAFDEQTIQGLLEWSPTVITKSDLVEALLPYGFKIDVVIGTITEKDQMMSELEHQQPFKYLSKNSSDEDLLLAIYFLIASKYKAVNLLYPLNPKSMSLINPFLNQLDLVFYDQGYKWVYSRSTTFSKWLPADSILKFRDPSIKVTQEDAELKLNFLEGECICDVKKEGQTVIKAEKAFWLGQSI